MTDDTLGMFFVLLGIGVIIIGLCGSFTIVPIAGGFYLGVGATLCVDLKAKLEKQKP